MPIIAVFGIHAKTLDKCWSYQFVALMCDICVATQWLFSNVWSSALQSSASGISHCFTFHSCIKIIHHLTKWFFHAKELPVKIIALISRLLRHFCLTNDGGRPNPFVSLLFFLHLFISLVSSPKPETVSITVKYLEFKELYKYI